MIQGFFKRNGILAITLVVLLASVVGLVGMIDAFVYQSKKKEIIFAFLNQNSANNFQKTLEQHLAQWQPILAGDQTDPSAVEDVREAARKIIRGESSVYRIQIRDANDKSIFDERVDKFKKFNNFKNSLWFGRFTGQVGGGIVDPRMKEKTVGSYFYYFTTPASMPLSNQSAIEALTLRYRLLTLGIAGILTLLTALFTMRVLIPMRNVIGRIESTSAEQMMFVARPGSRLEALYNRMARDALFTRLQERLSQRIEAGEARSGWELIQIACEFFVRQYEGTMVVCVAMSEEGPDRLAWDGRSLVRDSIKTRGAPSGDAMAQWLVETVIERARRVQLEAVPVNQPARRRNGLGEMAVVQIMDHPERPEMHYGFALALDGRGRTDQIRITRELLARLITTIGRAMESMHARYQILDRERGRASVNLSRNLGHDLTNIIATSKLDLMTLKRLLDKHSGADDGPHREILSRTLRGLLDSTRFMQEVVNLYRSYAFLRKPVFEIHNANDLADETVRLFTLSTSRKVQFNKIFDPEPPQCRVDPRLIKLALFNLFSNALDAIRRGAGKLGEQGTITLTTGRTSGGGTRIEVRDSGPGIMNEEGKLASENEIQRIFSLGYTHRRDGESEGEGLGLNWVRTIVQDIHHGTIHAENAPEGGARLTIEFPPVEVMTESNEAMPGRAGS